MGGVDTGIQPDLDIWAATEPASGRPIRQSRCGHALRNHSDPRARLPLQKNWALGEGSRADTELGGPRGTSEERAC